jgi:hypothetical protein
MRLLVGGVCLLALVTSSNAADMPGRYTGSVAPPAVRTKPAQVAHKAAQVAQPPFRSDETEIVLTLATRKEGGARSTRGRSRC